MTKFIQEAWNDNRGYVLKAIQKDFDDLYNECLFRNTDELLGHLCHIIAVYTLPSVPNIVWWAHLLIATDNGGRIYIFRPNDGSYGLFLFLSVPKELYYRLDNVYRELISNTDLERYIYDLVYELCSLIKPVSPEDPDCPESLRQEV